MNIDLTYLPAEDRMQLSIRGQADWLITRSLAIKLVSAWVEKLETTDFPNIGIPLGQRDISQEHAMSLEFDGPTTTHQKLLNSTEAKLLQEVTLTVEALGARLDLRGQGIETSLNLTRKESHMVLEMLARKTKVVGWLNIVAWPNWLGSH